MKYLIEKLGMTLNYLNKVSDYCIRMYRLTLFNKIGGYLYFTGMSLYSKKHLYRE